MSASGKRSYSTSGWICVQNQTCLYCIFPRILLTWLGHPEKDDPSNTTQKLGHSHWDGLQSSSVSGSMMVKEEKIIYLRWWLFWQAQLKAADGQSLAPGSKGLCSDGSAPSTPFLGLLQGPCLRDQCRGVHPNPSAEIPFPSHTSILFTASLCEIQQANITALLLLSCSSFISHHLVSCRQLFVSCRQDVGQQSEEASRLP